MEQLQVVFKKITNIGSSVDFLEIMSKYFPARFAADEEADACSDVSAPRSAVTDDTDDDLCVDDDGDVEPPDHDSTPIAWLEDPLTYLEAATGERSTVVERYKARTDRHWEYWSVFG